MMKFPRFGTGVLVLILARGTALSAIEAEESSSVRLTLDPSSPAEGSFPLDSGAFMSISRDPGTGMIDFSPPPSLERLLSGLQETDRGLLSGLHEIAVARVLAAPGSAAVGLAAGSGKLLYVPTGVDLRVRSGREVPGSGLKILAAGVHILSLKELNVSAGVAGALARRLPSNRPVLPEDLVSSLELWDGAAEKPAGGERLTAPVLQPAPLESQVPAAGRSLRRLSREGCPTSQESAKRAARLPGLLQRFQTEPSPALARTIAALLTPDIRDMEPVLRAADVLVMSASPRRDERASDFLAAQISELLGGTLLWPLQAIPRLALQGRTVLLVGDRAGVNPTVNEAVKRAGAARVLSIALDEALFSAFQLLI